MNKKILWGLIALLLIAGGGYFYVNKINAQVEEIAKATLAHNNITHSDVKYNCLGKTLTIKNVVFPYSDNEVKIDNSADEIIIKGINADSLKKTSEDKVLLCDEIQFNTIKSTVYAYGNEELITTTDQISIKKPLLNLLKLISLHRTAPYSEEYFQHLLDIRHNGITFQNISIQAFKGSSSEASFMVKNIAFPAYTGGTFDIAYHDINIQSKPLNLNFEKIELKNIALPTAKYLAEISQTVMRLNELERSSEFENNPSAILEYETLSELLINKLFNYPHVPFLEEVKILNSAIYLNEIEEVAQSPITLKELSYLFDENDTALKVNSTVNELTLAKEFLKNIVSPESLELFTEKFANGMVFSLNQSAELTKETGHFTQDTQFSVRELARLSAQVGGKILNKDKNLFLANYNMLFDDMTFEQLDEILQNLSLNALEFNYTDTGFIDFAFKIAANETGFPADALKDEILAALQAEIDSFRESEDVTIIDKEIISILETLIETIKSTGKFLVKVTLADEMSLKKLLDLETVPTYKFEVSAQ